MKKFISFCLMLAIVFSMLPAVMIPASGETVPPVTEPPVKDGYTLVPLSYGTSGIDIRGAFKLCVPEGGEVFTLAIDGEPNPVVTNMDGNEYSVVPAAEFFYNSLYIFRLSREGKPDITWAFQTSKMFRAESVFPGNEAKNVPVNTGIEIIFSSDGYTPVDDFFEISPEVPGQFIYNSETAIFVPDKSLEYRTVYTVTLKAGITLEGTNEKISSDIVFSFETADYPVWEDLPPSKALYFFPVYYTELPSVEIPSLSVNGLPNIGTKDVSRVVDINVYKFANTEEAAAVIQKSAKFPGWSNFARQERLIDDISGFTKVMNFEQIQTGAWSQTLEFPDKLSPGFYLIDASHDDRNDQMIIQVNDLPIQIVSDADKTIIWVNDITNGGALSGATVLDVAENQTYTTDENGLAIISREIERRTDHPIIVTAADGRESVWFYWGYNYGSSSYPEASYWRVLQLDRDLFQPDDTVSFFGFVQNRYEKEQINYVSAVLTQGWGWGYNNSRDILMKKTVPVFDGVFTDEFELPNLDPGSYYLRINHGDVNIGSIYFEVREYVKPPYKIEVSSDKAAVFLDDTVTFSAKASFFEGTPLPELDMSYRLYGWPLIGRYGSDKTNADGIITVPEKVTLREGQTDVQGITDISFNTEATLPEIGWTYKSTYVRVFINDIDVAVKSTREGPDAKLTVDVNSITLDRLNDGTAKHWADYLDKPVEGKTLTADVYRTWWEKVVGGTYYSYTEKQTVTWYHYQYHEEKIDSFTLTTGSDGVAVKNFKVPDREHESYYVKVSCLDGNGRQINHTRYIGKDWSDYFYSAQNYYYMTSNQDTYEIGDEVNLDVRYGADKVTGGSTLFITSQNGILEWQVSGENSHSFEFIREHAPNVYANAYYFNGFNYKSMSMYIRYEISASGLTVTAATDKDTYKPGDMCEVTVSVNDRDGNPVSADVNLSIVDEALFALRDYTVYPLRSLYSYVGSGLRFETSTHRLYTVDYGDYDMAADGGNMDYRPMPQTNGGDSSDDDTYLREIFKDTALFATVRTNADGTAVYTFKLPDNITSWRLTMSAINQYLQAGSSTQNITVTNPMFLHYSLSRTFLTGDTPIIGVNAYGTSLNGSERILFEVWDEADPSVKYTAEGAAFERVNIPLWSMANEGANALIIKASVKGGGYSDAVKHQFQILRTFRQIDEAIYYDVTADTVFETGKSGLTNITFTDKGRGQYLCQLMNFRYVWGNRIERLAASREADKMIKEYFPDINMWETGVSFSPRDYQQSDGGISVLPHAGSDVETTVRMMPLIKDDIDLGRLKKYLYASFTSDNNDNKITALYGLAMLKEPVLLDLQNYALLDYMTTRDAVYIALAFAEIGETMAAEDIYDRFIAPNIEYIEPFYRLVDSDNNFDMIKASSTAAILAAKLNKPESAGLHDYAVRQSNLTTYTPRDVEDWLFMNVDKLNYIKNEIEKVPAGQASITYNLFGETFTRDLRYGDSYTLRIPAQRMSEFRLTGVNGEVGAVSVFRKPMEETFEQDNAITVRRRYYRANEPHDRTKAFQHTFTWDFEQGDLIRVQIWIDYTNKDMFGSYKITDYLPAGLEYVSNSAKEGFGLKESGHYAYAKVSGQEVTFFDFNSRFSSGRLYYYYARVICAGTFRAESPVVQNVAVRDIISIGQDDEVKIKG